MRSVMKSPYLAQPSDEDLDLYLAGKSTPTMTARIEEHYFGSSYSVQRPPAAAEMIESLRWTFGSGTHSLQLIPASVQGLGNPYPATPNFSRAFVQKRWEIAAVAACTTFLVVLASPRAARVDHTRTTASLFIEAPAESSESEEVETPAPQEFVPAQFVHAHRRRTPARKFHRPFQLPPERPRALVEIAMIEPPTLLLVSQEIGELPFEPETPQVAEYRPKPNLFRRFLAMITAPFRLIHSLDKSGRA